MSASKLTVDGYLAKPTMIRLALRRDPEFFGKLKAYVVKRYSGKPLPEKAGLFRFLMMKGLDALMK
jgi:hypothetical protein